MIQRILVPLDGSTLAEQAISQAAAIAGVFDADLILLRVQDHPENLGPVDCVTWRLARAEAGTYLKRHADRLRAHGLRVESAVHDGPAAEEILEAAHERAVDLIVLCSHGRGGQSRFSLGSTAHKVVSRAGVSVLVVRPGAAPEEPAAGFEFHRILVPLDGSQRARWALCMAAALARAHHGELVLVHAVEAQRVPGEPEPTSEECVLARRLMERDRGLAEIYLGEMAALMASSGLAVRTRLVEAPHGVAQALEEVAAEEQASLVVLSAHGSGVAPWLYGSVAERLIAHGTLPLLVFQDRASQESMRPYEEPLEVRQAALACA